MIQAVMKGKADRAEAKPFQFSAQCSSGTGTPQVTTGCAEHFTSFDKAMVAVLINQSDR